LLDVYYLAVCGAAYVLIKRRAMARMVFVMVIAFASTTTNVYFAPTVGPMDWRNNPALDYIVWFPLLVLCWRMTREAIAREAEIRRQERQQRSERMMLDARTKALNCAAHELRTPVAGIAGSAEILVSETADQLSDEERQFLKGIHDTSRYMGTLLNDMLEYARGQAGGIELSPGEIDPREIAHECVSVVKGHAAQCDVRCDVEADEAADRMVADSLRLKQILLNLLSNAVKYAPPGGAVRLQVQTSGDDVLFLISDEGPGMTEEEIAHVFEPFYQAGQTPASLGTGLGLGIAKLLVDLHGGSISLDSEPGAGASFRVTLPRAGRHQKTTSDSNWEIPATRARRDADYVAAV